MGGDNCLSLYKPFNRWRNTFENFCDTPLKKEFCYQLDIYVRKNTEWMKKMIAEKTARDYFDPVWYQVSLRLGSYTFICSGCVLHSTYERVCSGAFFFACDLQLFFF